MINFYKYQGAGNDFVLIDNRSKTFKGDKVTFAKEKCDRRFGIGSDGIIFIEKTDKADFLMDFYNPDGSQSFCGNGSRCAVRFAEKLGIISDKTTFLAIDGLHEAVLVDDNVKIGMHQYGGVSFYEKDHFIDTGSPHYITYCEKLNEQDVVAFGRSIRYNETFKQEGTNVNLIEEKGNDHIAVRTYERGVENETLACGTGATACGLSFAFKHKKESGIVRVDVKGGQLKIHFKSTGSPGEFSNIWLEGPAEYVFKGEV